ncbi:MAG: diacylglycerol/lipid kinase family protein [Ruminococcus sp.]|jgi:diacylglycerol kinase (ATP)
MEKKLLFVFNPKSGKGLIKTKLLDIVNIFVRHGYLVTVHPTQYAQDAYHVVKKTAPLVDLIVCSGGDGTLAEVVAGIIDSKVQIPMGYIPSGSTNDFASSLSIPKNMEKAALEIMEGKLYGCDIGHFNSKTFVYIAAFGLFTDVSYQTDQALKNVLGHMAYILEGVKRIFDIKSYHLKVEANGKKREDNYIFGMVTNSRSVGGFKNLTGKNVEMDDGFFEVTLIREPKNPLELNEIMGALLTAVDDTDLIDSFKSDCVVIESEEPIPWTLDGEFGGDHSEICIENKKRALHILLNPKKHKDMPLDVPEEAPETAEPMTSQDEKG